MELLASLGECVDREGWRVVVELGCWRDGQLRVRLKKYQPSGRFYFCEGITLSLDAWRALALMAQQEIITPPQMQAEKTTSNKSIVR